MADFSLNGYNQYLLRNGIITNADAQKRNAQAAKLLTQEQQTALTIETIKSDLINGKTTVQTAVTALQAMGVALTATTVDGATNVEFSLSGKKYSIITTKLDLTTVNGIKSDSTSSAGGAGGAGSANGIKTDSTTSAGGAGSTGGTTVVYDDGDIEITITDDIPPSSGTGMPNEDTVGGVAYTASNPAQANGVGKTQIPTEYEYGPGAVGAEEIKAISDLEVEILSAEAQAAYEKLKAQADEVINNEVLVRFLKNHGYVTTNMEDYKNIYMTMIQEFYGTTQEFTVDELVDELAVYIMVTEEKTKATIAAKSVYSNMLNQADEVLNASALKQFLKEQGLQTENMNEYRDGYYAMVQGLYGTVQQWTKDELVESFVTFITLGGLESANQCKDKAIEYTSQTISSYLSNIKPGDSISIEGLEKALLNDLYQQALNYGLSKEDALYYAQSAAAELVSQNVDQSVYVKALAAILAQCNNTDVETALAHLKNGDIRAKGPVEGNMSDVNGVQPDDTSSAGGTNGVQPDGTSSAGGANGVQPDGTSSAGGASGASKQKKAAELGWNAYYSPDTIDPVVMGQLLEGYYNVTSGDPTLLGVGFHVAAGCIPGSAQVEAGVSLISHISVAINNPDKYAEDWSNSHFGWLEDCPGGAIALGLLLEALCDGAQIACSGPIGEALEALVKGDKYATAVKKILDVIDGGAYALIKNSNPGLLTSMGLGKTTTKLLDIAASCTSSATTSTDTMNLYRSLISNAMMNSGKTSNTEPTDSTTYFVQSSDGKLHFVAEIREDGKISYLGHEYTAEEFIQYMKENGEIIAILDHGNNSDAALETTMTLQSELGGIQEVVCEGDSKFLKEIHADGTFTVEDLTTGEIKHYDKAGNYIGISYYDPITGITTFMDTDGNVTLSYIDTYTGGKVEYDVKTGRTTYYDSDGNISMVVKEDGSMTIHDNSGTGNTTIVDANGNWQTRDKNGNLIDSGDKFGDKYTGEDAAIVIWALQNGYSMDDVKSWNGNIPQDVHDAYKTDHSMNYEQYSAWLSDTFGKNSPVSILSGMFGNSSNLDAMLEDYFKGERNWRMDRITGLTKFKHAGSGGGIYARTYDEYRWKTAVLGGNDIIGSGSYGGGSTTQSTTETPEEALEREVSSELATIRLQLRLEEFFRKYPVTDEFKIEITDKVNVEFYEDQTSMEKDIFVTLLKHFTVPNSFAEIADAERQKRYDETEFTKTQNPTNKGLSIDDIKGLAAELGLNHLSDYDMTYMYNVFTGKESGGGNNQSGGGIELPMKKGEADDPNGENKTGSADNKDPEDKDYDYDDHDDTWDDDDDSDWS